LSVDISSGGGLVALSILVLAVEADELAADQLGVDSVKGEQLSMLTALFDFTAFHDDNFISITHGGQSVRNNNNCLLTRTDQFVEGLLHLVLRLGIECGSSLIEKQHFGFAD